MRFHPLLGLRAEGVQTEESYTYNTTDFQALVYIKRLSRSLALHIGRESIPENTCNMTRGEGEKKQACLRVIAKTKGACVGSMIIITFFIQQKHSSHFPFLSVLIFYSLTLFYALCLKTGF